MSESRRQDHAQAFRRRQFQAPHRRRRLWLRLLRPALLAAFIVGAPVAVAAWTMTSGHFHLREVAVGGGGRLSPHWAKQQLEPLLGRHIFWIELADVEELLDEHPWFRGVKLRKQLPARIEVQILEREPTALLRDGVELSFLDAQGRVIVPYAPQLGSGDYVVVVATDEQREAILEALALAEDWRKGDHLWAGGLSEIEVVSDRDFRVYAAGLPCSILVNRLRLRAGLGALANLLPGLRQRYPQLETVDLRFSRQIVFQPVAEPPQSYQSEG